MDILVVGDCHGKIPEIGSEAENADVILATGDICGDSDEMRNAMFESIDSEKGWYDILGKEKSRKMVEKSLEEGDQVLEHLNSFGKPVFLVPGNWDWIGEEEEWEFLTKNRFQQLIDKYENIQNINCGTVQDSNFTYIGYGPCSGPEIPQYEDDKPTEEEMKELRQEYREKLRELQGLLGEAENPVIFLSHNVPNQTSLDEIQNPDSPADGRHYGSIIVRDLVEEFKPVLSVAGHIHEGKGTEEVEGVKCLNAGLHSHAMVEIEGGEVKNLEIY